MNLRIVLFLSIFMGFMLLVSLGMNHLLFSSDSRPIQAKQQASAGADKEEKVIKTLKIIDETPAVRLPAPSVKGTMSVEESLSKRRSVRTYQAGPMSLQQVSQILWAAYGISDSTSYSRLKLRTAPSAGATYPLDLYLLAGNVEGLEAGLYKFTSEGHTLTLVRKGDMRKEVAEACLDQKMLHQAPASIVYAAVYPRITKRYGDRGADRYLCMDIGHSAQNVYLQSVAMGMATCAVGAFNDEKLAAVLQLPTEEKIMYLMPVGVPE
ncbi:MAG: SagB/ThcOx family dehydrogenase [Bacteroidales bacterium]